jgi:type VI secretion system secreted protein VgrG
LSKDRPVSISVPAFGDDVYFAELRGGDAISRPFRYVIDFLSKSADLKAAKVLGTTVSIDATGDSPRQFNGLVAEFALIEIREDYTRYRLDVVPWLWFLSLRTDNRIFQGKSVVEIVEEVCKPYPKQKIDKRLQKSYPPREYCVQYGESDLNFVQRLLEHEGISYFFEHADGEHTLVLADANASLKPAPGCEKIPFEPDTAQALREGDFITEWKPRAEVRSGKYAQTDYDFEKPSSDLMSKFENPLGHDADGFEQYHYPGTYVDHGRGDKLSEIRLEELQAPYVRVRAKGNVRPLWSGRTFTLEEFRREAENEEYIVLGAEYRVWDQRFWSGEETSEEGYEVALDLSPKRIPYRPARTAQRPMMRGPQTAVVVGPSGEEIFTDEYARVKVQFHWDRLGKKDENTTCFVRVSQTWAGAGWGFIQIPRIGQEVIVDFLEGDPDQPIITGRVYNAEQMPPYGLPANATQSGWKSNSSPGGGGWNELRFEDKKGSEEVYFQAEKDHNELVKNNETRTIGNDWVEDVGHDAAQSIGHDRTESVANDKSVSVGNNRTVSIGVNDDETVGSNRTLTVGADETISIGSNSTETIGMNHSQTVAIAQTITVGAARVDTVGADEARTVGASQQQTVGVSRTVTVGSDQTHAIGSDDGWTVGSSQTVSIGADQGFTVGGGQSTKVAKDQATEVGGNRAIKVAKDQAHSVTGKMGMKVGKTFLLDVADEIAIKTGSAAIIMKKDGTITIEGKDITIKGSGKINVKANSEVTVKGSKINNN